jgi:hypothetical protein
MQPVNENVRYLKRVWYPLLNCSFNIPSFSLQAGSRKSLDRLTSEEGLDLDISDTLDMFHDQQPIKKAPVRTIETSVGDPHL